METYCETIAKVIESNYKKNRFSLNFQSLKKEVLIHLWAPKNNEEREKLYNDIADAFESKGKFKLNIDPRSKKNVEIKQTAENICTSV